MIKDIKKSGLTRHARQLYILQAKRFKIDIKYDMNTTESIKYSQRKNKLLEVLFCDSLYFDHLYK